MQEWYLEWEKVSCLERCPQFRISVLIYIDVHVQCEWKSGLIHTLGHNNSCSILHYVQQSVSKI